MPECSSLEPVQVRPVAAHLQGMTDQHLTTSQSLARYDSRQRKAAKAEGRPTDRTSSPGLNLAGAIGRVIHTGDNERLCVTDMRAPGVRHVELTSAVLHQIISDAYDLTDPSVGIHVVTLFADTATLRRTAKLAGRWASERGTLEAKQAARLMAYRANLPTSTYTPVLTEALASRYWLPAGPAVTDLSAWDTAFGHGHPTGTHPALLELIGRALDGVENTRIAKAMINAEKYGARAARSASTYSACSAFTHADSLTDAHTALLSVDPTLRERNVVAGVVSKINVHQIKQSRVEAYAENPGRLREGSSVYVFDDHAKGGHVELRLKSVEFHNDNLMLVLSAPTSRTANGYLIEEARKSYRPLFVAPAPYLMPRRAPKNRRWTVGGEDKALHVDIPVDVALAGGPTER